MEKRIDPNDSPLHIASTDPAFIPGITPAAPDEPTESAEPEAEPEAGPEAEGTPGASEAAGPAEPAQEPDASEATADADDDTADADDAEAEADADGTPESNATKSATPDDDAPTFEASDRRGAIEVNGSGVRFQLDDQEAEFTWDEIGAVEHIAARFGRRFTVTVHTTANRSYPAEVEAPSRRELKEWTARLDEVLDAHFEE